MKAKLRISDYEDRKSQNGKRYTQFDTNKGKMSCFEKDVINDIKEAVDEYGGKRFISVQIAESKDGAFTNIRGFNGVCHNNDDDIEDDTEEDIKDVETIKPSKLGKEKSPYEKDPVGLAVELCASGYSVENAIKAVKEIKEAFKE